MATSGDGRSPHGSGGAGEKFHKRPIQTDEGGNSAATGRISELEEMFKQVTVTMSSLSVSRVLHRHLHPTTVESLPDELLINIFISLFAKQLAQMRCVSKSWNELLSHPSFVRSHLHHSIHNNNHQILLVFDHSKPFTQYYSRESPHLEPTNAIKHIPVGLPMSVIGSVNDLICLSDDFYSNIHIWNPSLSAVSAIKHIPVGLPMSVIGSVNGLICLSDDFYSNIHIWNPSLSAVSAIPPPRSMHTWPKYETSIRFGFDPKTDDYKLVKLTGKLGTLIHIKKWLQVEVYSMRKGSWEFITQPFPFHITSIDDFDELCVDGHGGFLHWEIETVGKTEEAILAFDLGSETFREIPLPDSDHILYRPGVLAGSLCAMTRRNDGAFVVWVMEEYGVPESWVIRHVFSHFNDASCLFGFTSRNELLLLEEDFRLVLYDPIANKTN